MRSHRLVGVFILALAAASLPPLNAAGPPRRKPLGPGETEAVLALIKAIDLAQASDAPADPGLDFDHHILKAANYSAYVPFTLSTLTALPP